MDNSAVELSWRRKLSDWGYSALQIIDIRLAIALAVAVFLVVVSLDSSGNPAAAADLDAKVQQQTFEMSAPRLRVESVSAEQQAARHAIANRLRHSELIQASMTSSHLTRAHFFSDLSALH